MEHCRHLHLPICEVDMYMCRLTHEEITDEEMICQHCDNYRGSLESMWKKQFFWEGTSKALDTDEDSCYFHAMAHEHTEVLGQFCDRAYISPEELEDILVFGFLERIRRRKENENGISGV